MSEITANSPPPSKLTPAQRKALVWVHAHEPVSAFPCDGSAPALSFVKKMQRFGLVETDGVEHGGWGFTRFHITSAAKALLAHSNPPSVEMEKAS